MTVGPTLGTGVFVGTGQALAAGGPASLIICYIFLSVLVYCVTTSMAEISTHSLARDGALIEHTYHYTSRHLGFSIAYLRWVTLAVLVPFEVTTGMVNLGLWEPGSSIALRMGAVMGVIFFFNMLPDKVFRRSQAFFTGLKIVTTLGLILISLIISIRAGTTSYDLVGGFEYWVNPGPFNQFLLRGNIGRFFGVLYCLLCSAVAFVFIPELTVQRAEKRTSEPGSSIFRFSRNSNLVMFALYILSAFSTTLMSPYNEQSLTNNGIGAGLSPFVVGIEDSGFPVLPIIATGAIFLSSVASGRSFLNLSSRMLTSMAETGHAPAMFMIRNRWNVPYVSVAITGGFTSLTYLCMATSSSVVHNYLMFFITTSGYISWVCSSVAYLRFRQLVTRADIRPPHRSFIQPFGTWFALVSSVLLTLLNLVQIILAPVYQISRWNAVPGFAAVGMFAFMYLAHWIISVIRERSSQLKTPARNRAPIRKDRTNMKVLNLPRSGPCCKQQTELRPWKQGYLASLHSFAITHPATEPYPVTASLNSPTVNGTVSDSVPPEDEEPYTIKCICAFEDDDGNTVFCEGCETWQHIECYYHGRDVPDVHNCVDCEPRHLDGRRATERQRRLREQSDGGDRKTKRPGAKSHKKTKKDHGDQVNGFHQRLESSSRDQPPSKKTKTSHRASGSRSVASMSPTKLPGPSIPLYSNEFLHLYDQDHGHADMDGNLFVNLTLAADLASWVKDPVALAHVANGRPAEEIFTRNGAALDRSHWPALSLESMTDSITEVDGKHPTWKVLKTREGVGKIGLLRDYSLDPSNRWQELRHPEPFVFFHPQLPIYIDSRQEGSILRYARRSCRPNYHFCFVAKEDIPPDSEITATWYLDAQLFGSTNGLIKQEPGDTVPEMRAFCISNVLANFGGCACIPPNNCLLSGLDRRRHPMIADPSSKQVHAKRRKTKSKLNVSPPTNNSRAGSETIKNPDEDDHVDSHSASSSIRGQTNSRDLTPTLQTPTEAYVLGESELSARERRKIAAAEKKFQQLEQDQQTSHKRKKRVSGQSTQTPGASSYERQSYSPPLSAGGHGSPRKPSGPSTPSMRLSYSHSQYVDSAVQAELDVSNGAIPPPPSKRPSFIPLTQRLLKRCHTDRIRLEHVSRQPPVSPQSAKTVHERSVAFIPPAAPTPAASTPSVSGEKEDVEMRDLESPTGSSSARSQMRNISVDTSPSHGRGLGKPLPQSPWPSSAAHIARIPARKVSSPRADLHVPLPLATITPLPTATSPSSALSSAMSSPSTLDPSSQHLATALPGAGVAAPSPVKKKLSLGDYLIQRKGSLKTPTSEKMQTQATAMPPPTTPTQPSESRDSRDSLPTASTQTDAGSSTKADSPTTSNVTMKDVSASTQTTHLPSVS
ncbi:hypothetical protein BDV12DRAFT_183383 [Aspergillus spectabilis]